MNYMKPESISHQVEEYNIILNGSGEPVCITQTKVVYIMPYNLITPEHAWHEGDRSYRYWKEVHDKSQIRICLVP